MTTSSLTAGSHFPYEDALAPLAGCHKTRMLQPAEDTLVHQSEAQCEHHAGIALRVGLLDHRTVLTADAGVSKLLVELEHQRQSCSACARLRGKLQVAMRWIALQVEVRFSVFLRSAHAEGVKVAGDKQTVA